MTHRERFLRTLTGLPVDRVPFIKVFGGTNAIVSAWEKELPGVGQHIDEILKFEGGYRGWRIAPVNMDLASVGPGEVLQDDAEKTVRRRGDGALLLWQKNADYHSQVLEWPVRERQDWERIRARHLQADDPERFSKDWPAWVAGARERDWPVQLTHRGVYGLTRNLLGDVNLAYAFYDDPALVHEMMDWYTDMAIQVWERMVREVDFDLIEFWEDMASRNGAFISPDMFREFMRPNYLKVAAFARRHGIRVLLVDSDGYIEKLAPLMMESGVNCMYPFEVQAGNDVGAFLTSHRGCSAIGGLDKNCMARGRAAIDREIERARALIRGGRFIPGPDHFVLSDVTWDNYRYFMERLREVVMTTQPGG